MADARNERVERGHLVPALFYLDGSGELRADLVASTTVRPSRRVSNPY